MAELHMTEESGTPTTPGSNKWKAYFKSTGLFIIDDAGVETGPFNLAASTTASGIVELATSTETLTGTDAARVVTPDTLNDIVTRIPKDGEMLNGKLSVTVVSNDLVLALKTLAGADPSASDPIYININGIVRTVTAATSCTLADATNWFNSGAAELATKEIDYFAYAIWDSNSSIVAIAPARISHGRLVSDFSATTTNEKHLGNYANYTSTDDVCVIGRFAATLSAGAGYTWTVPTFTSANLIQHPIFETRWLEWTPTLTGFSANPTSTVNRYRVSGDVVELVIRQGADGTSNAGTFTITAPFTSKNITNMLWMASNAARDNSAWLAGLGIVEMQTNTNTMNIYKDPPGNAFTSSGGKRLAYMSTLQYEI